MGPCDVRLTTRYDENFLPGSLFSTLHEAGHGIYDQGLPKERYGLPTGEAVSLGIHESQSRMWENLVGRSRAFWKFFYPIAQQTFGEALGGVSPDDFYFAINDVRPSLIRTESDEVTYNLHILIRFELELALINDELKVADLPAAWHAKYREYLGIQSPTDADGVLQDVHWSSGAFGYFPTYSLGNLYAAQFFEKARQDLGDLDAMFGRGEFQPLREWLRTNIHAQGRRYPAAELGRRVTGWPLSHDALDAAPPRQIRPAVRSKVTRRVPCSHRARGSSPRLLRQVHLNASSPLGVAPHLVGAALAHDYVTLPVMPITGLRVRIGAVQTGHVARRPMFPRNLAMVDCRNAYSAAKFSVRRVTFRAGRSTELVVHGSIGKLPAV